MKQFETDFQNRAESFVALVSQAQHCSTRQQENALKSFLEVSYSREASQAIAFLLCYVDDAVIRHFSNKYLFSTALPYEVKTDIFVRPIPDGMMMKGNTGRFLIFIHQPDGSETQLKFTNKSAVVYYLMYLIDRHHKQGLLAPLSLQKNRDRFVELYCRVYDIPREKAMQTCDNLIRRYVDGKIRAGRENDVIYDIRRHLEATFKAQPYSYHPFAMTAHEHLSVSPQKIHFVGDAEKLLQYNFA